MSVIVNSGKAFVFKISMMDYKVSDSITNELARVNDISVVGPVYGINIDSVSLGDVWKGGAFAEVYLQAVWGAHEFRFWVEERRTTIAHIRNQVFVNRNNFCSPLSPPDSLIKMRNRVQCEIQVEPLLCRMSWFGFCQISALGKGIVTEISRASPSLRNTQVTNSLWIWASQCRRLGWNSKTCVWSFICRCRWLGWCQRSGFVSSRGGVESMGSILGKRKVSRFL